MQRKRVVAAAVIVSVTVAAVLWFLLWKPRADEDRPDIVVRNRKLTIETGKDWKEQSSAKKWKPDHALGKSVSEYEVSATNAKGPCASLKGDRVEVDFAISGTTDTFQFTRIIDASSGKYEPVVDAPEDLEHAGNSKKLRIKVDPEGGITALRVGAANCEFPNNAAQGVEITLKMNY